MQGRIGVSTTALDKRLHALENSAPIIDDLADYALWRAHGRNPNAKWDPEFKKQLEDAFYKMKEDRLKREAEKAQQ
jgi:ABC-type phosphate/phosphonate transport system substrate-binding protein